MVRIKHISAIAMIFFPFFSGIAASESQPGHSGMNEAGIVIVESAPVYPSPKSTRPTLTLARGDAVAAAIKRTLLPDWYYFEERYGRVRVLYLRPDGLNDYGWIETAALVRFYYAAACPPVNGPMMLRGRTWEWNACFMDARDKKAADIQSGLSATQRKE